MKLFLRLAAILLALFALTAVFLVVFAQSTLPPHEGELQFAQLDGPVRIARDEWGVPHIEAETRHDLYFALGVVHAQDRLWQLDLHRRIASGRLAELLGPDAVQQDMFLRTLGLYDRAKASYDRLPEAAKAMFKAYTDGVNAYVTNRPHPLPLEYQLTFTDFAPLDPVDPVAWLKVMSLDLSGNYQRELVRLGLSDRLTPDQIDQFYPIYPGSTRPPLPDLQALYDGAVVTTAQARGLTEPPDSRGSNNWVVDGQWTASGKPILANDPHLGFNTPSLWYLVHLKLADRNLVGVSMPGVPGVILGRNDRIAWGFTNTGPDTQDLYLERLVPGEGYLTPDGPRPFQTREEIIAVKDEEDRVLTVRETRHGPVISDAMASAREILPDTHVLALRWTALDRDDVSPLSLMRLMDVHTFDQFTEALADYGTPQQNMIYADLEGNIGYYAPARVPVRGEANTTHGLVPAPGWKPGFDWQGYLPYDALPRRYNPEDGMIVTANQKIVDESYPHMLSHRWALPYRNDRIEDLIRLRSDHDLASMAAIQMDIYSGIAEDLLPALRVHVDPKLHRPILDALMRWDRTMRADAPEPLIFASWHRHLMRALMADELGDRFNDLNTHKTRFVLQVLAGEGPQAQWCDDVSTPQEESCAEIVTAAWQSAIAELTERFGPDWRDWRWGELHRVRMAHRPLSSVPALADFFGIEEPIGGGAYTVNVAAGSFSDPHINRHGAGYRGLFDLSDLDKSRYIIATGQSGHPLSKHYRSLFPLWRDGRFIEIPARMPAEDAADWLVLRP